jgi:hypothetical protein
MGCSQVRFPRLDLPRRVELPPQSCHEHPRRLLRLLQGFAELIHRLGELGSLRGLGAARSPGLLWRLPGGLSDVQLEQALDIGGQLSPVRIGKALQLGPQLRGQPDVHARVFLLTCWVAAVGAPYHLFAKEKLASGWNTRRKPSVVLEAMDAHPGKTVVLMDVDCIVRGDIAPVANLAGDVGITVLARNMRKRDTWQHWIAAECSSRVVVFRQTDGARTFARRWAERIERSDLSHDEHSMIWTFLACPDVRFVYIDPAYCGREVSQVPDGIIVHESAHSAQRKRERGAFRERLRELERRFFRTGRTSRGKIALSQVLKGE